MTTFILFLMTGTTISDRDGSVTQSLTSGICCSILVNGCIILVFYIGM